MDPNASNEKGYWESYPISLVNDAILASGGSDWKDWHAFQPRWYETGEPEKFRARALETLKAEYDNSSILVFKDPRICRLYPFWQDVFKEARLDPRVVLQIRHPSEVAASLNKRDQFPEVQSLLIWLRNVLEAEQASRGTPRVTVTYDMLLKQPEKIANSLQDGLDLVWPRLSPQTLEQISAHLDDALRNHQAPDQRKITTTFAMRSWVETVYDILCRWSEQGEAKSDYATLDQIRTTFDDMAAPLHRIVANIIQQDTQIKALEDESKVLEAKTKASEAAREQLGKEKAILNNALNEREGAQRKAEQERQKLAEEKAAVQAELEARNTECTAIEGARAQLAKEKADLAEALTTREAAQKESEEARQKLAQEKAELEDHLRRVKLNVETIEKRAKDAQTALTSEVSNLHSTLLVKDTELVTLTGELIHTKDTLDYTQSALLQRTHETEQTAADLRDLRAEYKTKVDELQANVAKLQESVQDAQNKLADVRAQSKHDLKLRFNEIAALSRSVIEREDAFVAERDQVLQDLERLKAELDESSSNLAHHESTLSALSSENAALLHQSEHSHDLGGRMQDAVKAIIEGGRRGGKLMRPLEDRRKARLLKMLGLFDAEWYVAHYTDVRENGADPVLHFIRHGYAEGRAPSPGLKRFQKATTHQ